MGPERRPVPSEGLPAAPSGVPMLGLNDTYESCIRASEKVSWRVDDILPPNTRLDFSRPFLPAALAARGDLEFLAADERRKLNQIAANAYLNLFAFVEEYILATVIHHAQAEMFGDHDAIRALVRFADEEVKHQRLFARYRDAFDRDFGHGCEVLGQAAQVAGVILTKSPIAVMLTTYHIELMTQAHYVECVRDDSAIDPLFAKLLHAHWLEESQHARIDGLELQKLVREASPGQIAEGFDDYLDIIAAFDGLLKSQSEMDVRSLARATCRAFTQQQSDAIVQAQHAGYRRTFLWYGMTNPAFREAIEKMDSSRARRVGERAAEVA
jgi:hypothetical protein